jgi:hypothetical protein
MAQDYIDVAINIMLHPLSKVGPYGYGNTVTTTTTTTTTTSTTISYPLEHMSTLSYVKNAARRPMVIERFSPYEIAVFEAGIAEYGKDFHRIRQEIGTTKSTKDVIEFYYIWKKTSHYQKWKQQYIPDYMDMSEDDDDDTTTAAAAVGRGASKR